MLALLFPGQGSQEVGMGRDVAEASQAARDVFAAADAALGFPVSELCFEGPEDELLRTEVQQPAILTTCVALLQAIRERRPKGFSPAFVAGHSLGEYAALVAATALRFEDAVRLVRVRGRYMQEAVPPGRGTMAAVIGCDPKIVEQACEQVRHETGLVVTPANMNSPLQTVIAGDSAAVERACNRARENGARRAIPLPVSAPFHCPLMAPVAKQFGADLKRIRFSKADPPVVTNVEARPNSDATRMPGLLETQLTAPVRFTEMVENLCSLGVTHFLEIGPGRTLTGLVARISRGVSRASLATLSDLDSLGPFLEDVGPPAQGSLAAGSRMDES